MERKGIINLPYQSSNTSERISFRIFLENEHETRAKEDSELSIKHPDEIPNQITNQYDEMKASCSLKSNHLSLNVRSNETGTDLNDDSKLSQKKSPLENENQNEERKSSDSGDMQVIYSESMKNTAKTSVNVSKNLIFEENQPKVLQLEPQYSKGFSDIETSLDEKYKILMIKLMNSNHKNPHWTDEIPHDSVPDCDEIFMNGLLEIIMNYLVILMERKKFVFQNDDLFTSLQAHLLLLSFLNYKKHEIDFKRMNELYMISKGGQASVYRVYDYYTKNSIARRIRFIQGDVDMRYVLQEIAILIKLLRQNDQEFIHVYEINISEKTLTMTFEYGLGDLDAFLNFIKFSQLSLSSEEVSFIMKQINDQFEKLKNLKIYHRDIKPANIIIDENWNFKFIDFGVAEMIDHEYLKYGLFCIAGTPGFWHPDIESAYKKGKRDLIKINLEEADLHSIKQIDSLLKNLEDSSMPDEIIDSQVDFKRKYDQNFQKFQKSQLFKYIIKNSEECNVDSKMARSYLYQDAVEWIDEKIKLIKDENLVEKLDTSLQKAMLLSDMHNFEESKRIESSSKLILDKLDDEILARSKLYSNEYDHYKKIYSPLSFHGDLLPYTKFLRTKLHVAYLEVNSSNEKDLNKKISILNIMLQENLSLFGSFHESVAKIYHDISVIYGDLADYQMALDFLEKSLGINLKVLGPNHSNIAQTYNSFGLLFYRMSRYEDSLEYLNKSIKINSIIFGPYHSTIAAILNNIATIFMNQQNYKRALEYLNNSLTINVKIFGQNHISTGIIYSNFASAYTFLSKYEEGLEYCRKALDIFIKILGSDHEKVAHAYAAIAQIYTQQNRFEEAIDYFSKSFDINIKIFGPNHLSIAHNYYSIGQVYQKQTKYEQALEYFNKSLNIDVDILGLNHISVARTYSNIAQIYSNISRHDEALEYLNKSNDIGIKKLGFNHTFVANNFDEIAQVYLHLANYTEAMEYLTKSLEIKLAILEPDHVSLAGTYNNMAGVYNRLGRHDEAIEYHTKSIDIASKTFGLNHTSIAASYNNIAGVFFDQAMYEKALEYYNKSLEIYLEILGSDNILVASNFNNIARVYSIQAKHDKSLEYFKKSLDIKIKQLGTNHSSVATTYDNIAQVFSQQAKYSEALEHFKKSLIININVFGAKHPSIATNYNNIAQVYSNLARFKEALEYYTKSLEIKLDLQEANHTSVATTYNNIAGVYSRQARYNEAIDHYLKALEIFVKNLGLNHTSVATTYNNIGQVYTNLGQYDQALDFYDKFLNITKKNLGSNHVSIATAYNNIAGVYSHQGKYDDALDYQLKSLDIKLKILGATHPSTATTYNNIAQIFSHQSRYDEAIEYYNKALEITIKKLGSNHSNTATIYTSVALVYSHKRRYDEALEYYKRSLDINIKVMGPNHASVSSNYIKIAEVYSLLNKSDNAIEYYTKSFSLELKTTGANQKKIEFLFYKIYDSYSNQANRDSLSDIRNLSLASNSEISIETLLPLARCFAYLIKTERFEESVALYFKYQETIEKLEVLSKIMNSIRMLQDSMSDITSFRDQNGLKLLMRREEIKIDEIAILNDLAETLFEKEQYLAAKNLYLEVESYMSFKYHQSLESEFSLIVKKMLRKFPLITKREHIYFDLD